MLMVIQGNYSAIVRLLPAALRNWGLRWVGLRWLSWLLFSPQVQLLVLAIVAALTFVGCEKDIHWWMDHREEVRMILIKYLGEENGEAVERLVEAIKDWSLTAFGCVEH